MARLVYAFNYLICAIVGAVIGFFAGAVLWALIVHSFFPPSWQAALVDSGHEAGITAFVSFGGAGYSISRFIRAYEQYQNLLELQRLHRLVYYPFRHWFQETINVVQTALWAAFYIFTETFFPPVVAISVCLIVWSVMEGFLVGYPWFYRVPVGFLCFYGFRYIVHVASEFVYHLYQPKRLERELKEAQANMAVIRTRQEEERARQEGLKGGEKDSLPGRRGK